MVRFSSPLRFSFLFLALGCSMPSELPREEIKSFHSVYKQIWSSNWNGEFVTKTPSADFSLQGVAQHRLRQNWLLGQGQRSQVFLQTRRLMLAAPQQPEAHYLHARILQDPLEQKDTFLVLVKRFPNNTWILLGCSASHFSLGEIAPAREFFQRAKQTIRHRSFEPLQAFLGALELRLWPTPKLWQTTFQQACLSGNPELFKALFQADILTEHPQWKVWLENEIRFRRSLAKDKQERLFALLAREVHWVKTHPKLPYQDLLSRLLLGSHALEIPGDWQKWPLKGLAGFLFVLDPAAIDLAICQLMNQSKLRVILGQAPGRGLMLHLLQGIHQLHLTWEGKPIQILLAEEQLSSMDNPPRGGAVFAGFYAVREAALKSTKALFDQSRLVQPLEEGAFPNQFNHQIGSRYLPEDFGLSRRLRLSAQSLLEAQEKEWRSLLIHEAGHLPDTLGLFQHSLPSSDFLMDGFVSFWRWGSFELFLEYRAQLRALASGLETDWLWAQTLDAARNPDHPYFFPYRSLVLRLLAQANKAGIPDLSRWGAPELSQLSEIAVGILRDEDLQPIPAEDLRNLLSKAAINIFVQ